MSSWTLVPCLAALRSEFNAVAAKRDKASDGAVGDAAHSKTASDHNPDESGTTSTKDADKVNEVHAIDVDKDLKTPGWDMTRALQIIITRHKAGLDDRLQYVIHNRRIWSKSWGWTARAYTGKNAHLEHAHFSAVYTSAQEASTKSWGLTDVARAAAGVPESTGNAAAPGTRLLKQGMSGRDVAFLQRWTGAKDTGVFDASTKARVVRYQKIVGLVADGICGAKTWSKILGRAVKL